MFFVLDLLYSLILLLLPGSSGEPSTQNSFRTPLTTAAGRAGSQ